MCIQFLRSHGCTAPGGRLEPRKYCHLCRPVGRATPPGAAGSAPCDDTAPGREASQSVPVLCSQDTHTHTHTHTHIYTYSILILELMMTTTVPLIVSSTQNFIKDVTGSRGTISQ